MRSYLSILNKNITMALVCAMIMSITTFAVAAENSSVRKKIVVKGTFGSLDGEVGHGGSDDAWVGPSAIAVDYDGNIYIADDVNERIVKYDKNGKFKSKIALNVLSKRYSGIVSDLATDLSGNLYIASRHEKKIYKYTSDGKHVFSINLNDENICSSERGKWYAFAFQVMGMKPEYDCASNIFELNLDQKGNIYLKGSNWVVKFDSKGTVLKKLAAKDNSLAYFLDESENLYVKVKADDWEKYDSEGLSLGPVKCTEPILGKLCGRDQYPMFIDKSGFIYSFDYEKGAIAKKDIHGKYFGEYKMKRQYPNEYIKFDGNGNLYMLELDKNQFSIKKVSWN
jgi:tripartite motif-containing protein 71